MTASFRLAGGQVVIGDGSSVPLDVEVADGRIVQVAPHGADPMTKSSTVDASGLLVAPGFIDVQINGGWGHDFTSDPHSIAQVAERLPSTGVTAIAPTIITSSGERRRRALDAFAGMELADGSAAAVGLHLEGPAISPRYAGAHDHAWIGAPPPDEVAAWTRQAGVAMVTLAPEVEGALELVSALTARGVVVSAGHTACSPTEFAAARAAGLTMVTHLFNAMGAFAHRGPGPVGATLADDEVCAGLICDGIHVDPVTVRMAWRSLGRERTILVTDAIAALGLDAGTVRLADLDVVADPSGVRSADGMLAGSDLSLDQAVRNLVAYTGCSPAEAIGTVTTNPARLLGLTDRGRVEVGARADLVLLDRGLHVERTIIGGHTAWKS